jgi:hypothetical protein
MMEPNAAAATSYKSHPAQTSDECVSSKGFMSEFGFQAIWPALSSCFCVRFLYLWTRPRRCPLYTVNPAAVGGRPSPGPSVADMSSSPNSLWKAGWTHGPCGQCKSLLSHAWKVGCAKPSGVMSWIRRGYWRGWTRPIMTTEYGSYFPCYSCVVCLWYALDV